MDINLQNIDEGFKTKNSKTVYSSLLSFLVSNQNRILFQKHPLGFKYFKLGNISNFEEFRLHFWTKTNDKQDDDLQIHDHSFDFESFVINGSIINNKFTVDESINSSGFIYDVKFSNDKSKLILNSDSHILQITNSEIINTGNFYKMKSDEFHESANNDNLTITLLKIIKHNSKTARVFSPKKLGALSTFERTFLTEKENKELIDKIIELIELKK
jgi:hypothetical protein